MAEEGFKRKLAAILSADVEGYSRLMDDDEEATVRTLKAYRASINDLVQQYRGRIVDSPGDNILAEFSSVVDAVNCAVEIQRDLAERNAELAYNRKMEFRIGVNLGDVIEDDGNIYGDGVNIAARVESLAEAGGICISGRAYDQVLNKLGLEYENLGEHQVKNISVPIRVYRVLSHPGAAAYRVVQAKETLGRKWRKIVFVAGAIIIVAVAIGVWQFYSRRPSVEPASVEKMALPLPDKPSIAVLPFVNMSADPDQQYFCDGFTEQIITSLSMVPKVFVIAHNSTSTYKGKAVKVQQVAEELGVQYVLEGSIQKEGQRVRIIAQLIDAISGRHLWAERYDRGLKDIFALQDEITIRIITELRVKLTDGEQARLLFKGTDNLSAYLKYLQAWEHFQSHTKEKNASARRLLGEAIAIDPEFPQAYSLLGATYWMDIYLGSSKSPKLSLIKAVEFNTKANSLNDSIPFSISHRAWLNVLAGKHDKAIEDCELAISLNPNSAHAHVWMGYALRYAGRHEEAVRSTERALRLNPMPRSTYFRSLGLTYIFVGRYEEAIEAFNKALDQSPNDLLTYFSLACVYSLAGSDEDAQAAVEKVLQINPNFSIKNWEKRFTYKNKADKEFIIGAAKKAGLPYNPPLPLPDKPSIAVLAFDNLSGDPEWEYFSDGIAENIITALSKVGELFVIARNSSFTYKGKPVKIQQVSQELGVRYALEGSAQKSGDRVRITAQLIDAKNGQHLWAENYDRDLKDIFEIQDEITVKIVTGLRVELTEGEQARIQAKKVKNPDVYLKSAQAQSLWRDGTKESLIRYGQLAQEIVDMEPEYPVGYRLMAWYHYGLASRFISLQENLKKAFALSQKALAMDESDGWSHALLGYIYLKMKKYEKAIESGKRSVELQPNGALVNVLLGSTLSYAGRIDEAIAYLKQALRLNPFPAYYYYSHLGRCYTQKGQYENALAEYKKALQRAPEAPVLHGILAVTYVLLDREEEARASAAKCLELAPNFSVSNYLKISSIKNQAFKKLVADSMRKAGFPE